MDDGNDYIYWGRGGGWWWSPRDEVKLFYSVRDKADKGSADSQADRPTD